MICRSLKFPWRALAAQVLIVAAAAHAPLAAAQVRGGSASVASTGQSVVGGGSSGEALRGGVTAFNQANGFGCGSGKWGVQDGLVKCMVDVVAAIPGFAGKTIYIRFPLINGFTSGRVLRLQGTDTDIRVDILDVNGALGKSCFLTVVDKPCHLGSPGGFQPNLGVDPRYAYILGGVTKKGSAAELVGGNLTFTDDRRGGPLQDNYIVTAAISDGGLALSMAGAFNMGGTGPQMSVVYARGSFTAAQLATAINNDTWTASTSWAGPTN